MAQHDQLRKLLSGYRLAVLCGGPGSERDVSLRSGDNAHQALIRAGVAAEKVVLPAHGAEDAVRSLDTDVAVLMLHGEFGEDGQIQRLLAERGIGYTGSDPKVSALTMDKNASKIRMREAGIPTPCWAVCSSVAEAPAAVAAAGLAYPLFVKPNFGGSSVGVSRVASPETLPTAVTNALSVDRLAMIEELVEGRELTISWLDGQVLPIIELVAEGVFYDYHAKYISEGTRYLCPAPLEERTTAGINSLVANTARLMGVRDAARVDIMFGVDGPRVLEVNTLPGYTTHSLLPKAAAAAGITIETLTMRLAAMAIGRMKEVA